MSTIDPFDYKEPACVLCGGEEFYYPDRKKPSTTVPIRSVIEKIDALYAKNDLAQAEKVLSYWLSEAKELGDKRGELEIRSEQIGLYRKLNDAEKGLESVEEGMKILSELELKGTVSGATIAALADVGRDAEAEIAFKKAISILTGQPNKENDIAVSYVNLAHLLEGKPGREDEMYACVEKAIELLDTPGLPQNGYHAFVIEKCLPSIEYFGYFMAKNRLEKRMKEIYARA